jgi:acyl-CoA thioesterase-2
MTVEIETLPVELQLHAVADHVWEATPTHEGEVARNVVFGGQILAQMIMASHLDREAERPNTKEVKSIHAIFARAGDYTLPIQYEVERMHDGRTMGSDSVTFSQGGKIMSRGLILWSNDEPDLIRHTAEIAMPDVPGPDSPHRTDSRVFPGATGRVIGGVEPSNPDQPEVAPLMNVWTRFTANYPSVVDQAILSWATDGYLIGTSMLAHHEINEGQSHRTISTGVLSHTINFHEPFAADEWLLLAHESVWAGRGRTHGRCTIWTEDGRLVATYTQDNLVRSLGGDSDQAGDFKRAM